MDHTSRETFLNLERACQVFAIGIPATSPWTGRSIAWCSLQPQNPASKIHRFLSHVSVCIGVVKPRADSFQRDTNTQPSLLGGGDFPILASISIWGVVNIRGSAVELICDTCLVLRLPSKPSTSPQKGTGNFGGAQQYWAPNCSWGAAIR